MDPWRPPNPPQFPQRRAPGDRHWTPSSTPSENQNQPLQHQQGQRVWSSNQSHVQPQHNQEWLWSRLHVSSAEQNTRTWPMQPHVQQWHSVGQVGGHPVGQVGGHPVGQVGGHPVGQVGGHHPRVQSVRFQQQAPHHRHFGFTRDQSHQQVSSSSASSSGTLRHLNPCNRHIEPPRQMSHLQAPTGAQQPRTGNEEGAPVKGRSHRRGHRSRRKKNKSGIADTTFPFVNDTLDEEGDQTMDMTICSSAINRPIDTEPTFETTVDKHRESTSAARTTIDPPLLKLRRSKSSSSGHSSKSSKPLWPSKRQRARSASPILSSSSSSSPEKRNSSKHHESSDSSIQAVEDEEINAPPVRSPGFQRQSSDSTKSTVSVVNLTESPTSPAHVDTPDENPQIPVQEIPLPPSVWDRNQDLLQQIQREPLPPIAPMVEIEEEDTLGGFHPRINDPIFSRHFVPEHPWTWNPRLEVYVRTTGDGEKMVTINKDGEFKQYESAAQVEREAVEVFRAYFRQERALREKQRKEEKAEKLRREREESEQRKEADKVLKDIGREIQMKNKNTSGEGTSKTGRGD